MQHIIFYSWQADLRNSTNRGFIQTALEEAASAVANDLNVEPVIERDTQNVPGSPDIANTIFKKIASSDVFVADITLINPKSAKRRTPNPNVLLELGYALHALGEDRIILVMNRAYGPLEALPFDLKMRRVIPYDMPEEATERAPERKRLASILAQAIKAAIASIAQAPPAPDAIEAAITAIEAAAPNRPLLIRRAMNDVTKELERVAPPSFLDGATVDHLLEALSQTAPAVRAFTRLSEAVAGMNDVESARALYKAFTALFERYDNPKGFVGRYDERDFDYWKFLGHELLITLTATLLREERYETITAILEETVTVATSRRTLTVTFGYASEWLPALEPRQKETHRLSLHADLLHQRHARKDRDTPDGPLAEVLPFDQFIAADYFLYLRGELESDKARDRGFEWIPWTSVYLEEAPDFINSATRTAIAKQLATALGTPDVPTLKRRLLERAGRLATLWSPIYDQPLTKEQVERIGTR